MELIEGHTLREYLNERGKLSIDDGIEFLSPILSALAAAHKIGIVHRDIKPENIFIIDLLNPTPLMHLLTIRSI